MNTLIKQFARLRFQQQSVVQSASKLLAAPALHNSIDLNRDFHSSDSVLSKWNARNHGPQKWTQYNKVVHPPQLPDEEPRKAYICHQRTNIKYSPDKMWYIACLVRGLSVDEAVKQLNFVLKKGAVHVKETILEAQEMAVKRHNVEFRSNLWVAESFVGKGRVFRGMRRHARMRAGRVEYKHCHYFVRLEEGDPPKHYYLPEPQTPEQQLDNWLQSMRNRKVTHSL